MADDQQQLSDDGLDVVQHPTLGTLKFPKDMSPEDRNSSIESLELKTGAGMEAAAHEQARETPTAAAAKMQPNYTALALSNSPSGSDPHNAANPNLNAIPQSERSKVNSDLATTAGLALPAMGAVEEIGQGARVLPTLMRTGRTVIGGMAGGGLGATVGSRFGVPGEVAGSVIGGLAGGTAAGGLGRVPATEEEALNNLPGKIESLPGRIERFIPEWMVPKGEPGSITNPGPNIPAYRNEMYNELGTARMNRPELPPEIGTPENPGFMAKLPTRMPRPQLPPPELGTPENPGMMARIPTRMPRIGPSGAGRPLLESGVPASSPDDLISRTRALVKPGEAPSAVDLKRAGDLTQAPLARLRTLAKFGDKLAENEINRRLRNQ